MRSVKLVRFKLIFGEKKNQSGFLVEHRSVQRVLPAGSEGIATSIQRKQPQLGQPTAVERKRQVRDNSVARNKSQQWLILVLNLIEGYLTRLLGLTIHKEVIFIKKHMFLVLLHETSVTSHCG